MHDIYIWSHEHPIDLAPLKAAKARLEYERDSLDGWRDVPEKVKPVAVRGIEQLPGLDTRVLAVGSRPPFLCDYFLVSPDASPEEWVEAFVWVVTDYQNGRATTIVDTLTSHFGPGVREVPPEEIEGMQRLRDYQQNRV